MILIPVKITNRRASWRGTEPIVCGNSDYRIAFEFDAEWNPQETKTVRFVYRRAGQLRHVDQVFNGDTVAVPVLQNTTELIVGVFAGDLHTTTPARILCEQSIRCHGGAPEEPRENVYDQIMSLLSGDVFYPHVDEDGTLSWSNPAGLDTPEPVNIMGPQGEKGDTGATGPQGPQGPGYSLTDADKSAIASLVKASLATENWTFTLEDGSTTTKAVYVK